MERGYGCLINEGNSLMNTFTISYEVTNYEGELFSSTYDELSNWVRKALKLVEENENDGKESELYIALRRFRGRAGDITLKELKIIISKLQAAS